MIPPIIQRSEFEKSIPVVVGVIFNQKKEVLIAQRPPHKPFGGLWEFPGGKVEPGENLLQALQRELFEELGIEVQSYRYWGLLEHDYGMKQVTLYVYLVDRYIGNPYCKELQTDMQWVSLLSVAEYPLLRATSTLQEILCHAPL